MLSVIHLVDAADNGERMWGKETMILELLRHQARSARLAPTLATFSPATLAERAESEGIATEVLYPGHSSLAGLFDAKVRRLLTERRPHLLHTHGFKANVVGRLGRPSVLAPSGDGLAAKADEERGASVARWQRRLAGPLARFTKTAEALRRLESERFKASDQRQEAMQTFDDTYKEAFGLVEALFRMAGLDAKLLKSMRSYRQRRSLAHWAREKRRARAVRPDAEVPAEGDRSRREETGAARSPGAVATVSRWLRKLRLIA